MTSTIYGFIYDDLTEQNALQLSDVGKKLNTTIVPWRVYEDVANIIVNHWPGNLWFVQVIQAFSISNEGYLPAIAIKPIKQLPCSLLFGLQGEGICQLLDKIKRLTLLKVEELARFANPISDRAYANAWNCWLKKATKLTMHHDADHSSTLAIGFAEESSPIYSGFLAVDYLLRQRACELVGKDGSKHDMDSIYQAATWRKACNALLYIAMGVGAEQYVVAKDLPLLLLGLDIINN
ncbi:hypothetical protein DM558_13520 [Entomomonas moraniae]|uniref:Uncharacterized protein n=1 Tax=Entomomonas moraniae TaxID=2213226 RepID=A0A451EPJ2_9GAMM|nr:hypothetical protein [Entomomonas moraniae]AZS51723.1 hypothetical protein DM558_13520 [Entomomonas moraniae]